MSYDLELDFDSLQPIEKKVRVGKADYLIREANGIAYSQYQAAQMRNIEVKDGTTRFLGSSLDVDTVLLAGCLFQISNPTDKYPSGLIPVPREVIRVWPKKILEPLIELAKEISDLKTDDDLASLEKEKDKIEAKILKLKGKDEKNPTDECLTSTDLGSDSQAT